MISYRRSPQFIVLLILFLSPIMVAQSIITNKNDDLIFNKNPKHLRSRQSITEKESLPEEKRDLEDKDEKFDEPDKFFEYQQMIRTREGKTMPDYLPNYQIQELNKAKESLRLSKKTAQILNWIERGPGNVSGRTIGILVDPMDPSGKTWFAGSASGGVWKTTDMGYNWTNKTPELPNLATTVLSQSASNPDIIYCGTGEGFNNIDAVKGGGIFKSTDHGETWIQLKSTANFNFYCVNRIIIDPKNPDILFACTRSAPDRTNYPGSIHRSTDGGATWTRVFSTTVTNGVQDLQTDPNDFSTQYAAVYATGVYKSTDGGLTWTNPGTGISASGRIEIAVSRKNSSYIYAAAEISGGSALYMSTDGGKAWNKIAAASGSVPNWLGGQGWYDNIIAVNPYNEKIVYLGGIDIWKAEIVSGQNNTANFTALTDAYSQYGKPYVHPDHHSFVIVPKDSVNGLFWIINGNDGGVAVSTNSGSTWRETLNGGYNTTQFYGVDKKPGSNEYIGGTQDNGTWISPQGINADKKTAYARAIGGDGFEAAWHYKDPLKIIGSSQYNSFNKTTDGGITWRSAVSYLSDVGSGKGQFISKIAKSNTDPDVIFTTGSKGIWRSENFGDSWNLSSIVPNDTIPNFSWSYNSGSNPVSISIADPQVVWAGSSFSNSSSRLFLSTDGGLTFRSVKPYSGVSLGNISGIDTHPTDPKTAYLMFSISGAPKILKTTDLGSSWKDITGFGSSSTSSNGFPNVATYCLIQMPYNTNILWAGTEIGLFESTDNGLSWHYADNGLPSVCIWDMRIVDDQVVLATHGRGIYSVTLSELSGYKPPAATLSPLLTNLAQGPDGALIVQADLRSVYDSVLVKIDNKTILRQENTIISKPVMRFSLPFPATVSVQITAYKGEKIYKTMAKDVQLMEVQAAKVSYYNDFNKITNDFSGYGFRVSKPAGFGSSAIHSNHPYSTLTEYTYTLLYPIKISADNAYLEYDDIAIVEKGDPGAKFGDAEFWDYVAVEASKDGFTWIPVEDGYDCNYNGAWRSIWDSKGTPDSTKFIHHKVNLQNRFHADDVVLIRFRLFSDEAETGWGWAIDNVSIQANTTGINEGNSVPGVYSLSQNYPNPFNPLTTISYGLSKASKVKLIVYDMLGREISTLVNKEQNAGKYKIEFNASSLPSGVYIYKLEAGDFKDSKKLLLLK